MNPSHRNVDEILSALDAPRPPDALRDRVLDRAGAALDRPVLEDRWSRIYFSRPLRAAWALTVLGLIAAHLLVPRPARPPEERRLVDETSRRIPELREILDLPRLSEAYVSIGGFADRKPEGAPAAPAGSARKEKSS